MNFMDNGSVDYFSNKIYFSWKQWDKKSGFNMPRWGVPSIIDAVGQNSSRVTFNFEFF